MDGRARSDCYLCRVRSRLRVVDCVRGRLLSLAHLGIDPGSATGGFTLLAAGGKSSEKIPVLVWGHYRRAYKTENKVRRFAGFLLDVHGLNGYTARHRLKTLIDVFRVIRAEVSAVADSWTLTVEGLFIGADKSQRDMIELIDSGGIAKGVLAHPDHVDKIARPTASTWRASVLRGAPRSKKGAEAYAKRAAPRRFENFDNCKVIHAIESAFICLYGRLSHETF